MGPGHTVTYHGRLFLAKKHTFVVLFRCLRRRSALSVCPSVSEIMQKLPATSAGVDRAVTSGCSVDLRVHVEGRESVYCEITFDLIQYSPAQRRP